MATNLQENALNILVEAGRTKKRILKGQVLKKAGYSKAVQEQPQKVFESKGFLKLCDELGLTDDFLAKALYDDIKAKPKRREKELRLAFQIKGKLSNENTGGNTYNFNYLTIEQQQRIARRIQISDTEGERGAD